jgi:hypothetical protein
MSTEQDRRREEAARNAKRLNDWFERWYDKFPIAFVLANGLPAYHRPNWKWKGPSL